MKAKTKAQNYAEFHNSSRFFIGERKDGIPFFYIEPNGDLCFDTRGSICSGQIPHDDVPKFIKWLHENFTVNPNSKG